ncbi:MAG: murein biosynthesis integral membrane protein MurJ [Coriobacteriales bacterium]|jgi:putative peptidoglycan lipid II flippase
MQRENETESLEEPRAHDTADPVAIAETDDSGTEVTAGESEIVGADGEVDDDVAGVVRSTITMSMATMLSRITGFIRTWACAFALGNTVLASAYQVANNIPNMLFELVAGGIITTAFLPVFVSTLKTRGNDGANKYASNLMCLAAIALAIIALLATVFAPQVVFTQTFMSENPADVAQAIFFFRFFAIQIVFYGMGGIISGILNGHKHFLWPSLGPVFNNIVVIITMFSYVFINKSDPELAKVVLAVGTSLGVVAMMAVQIPALRKHGVKLSLHIDFHDPALRETLRIALPATVFVVVNLIVVSFRNAFSLGVAPNGPSTLTYAWLWYQFPYGVIGVALSTAMLTEMSGAAALKNWDAFRKKMRGGLSGTLFLIIPLAALMFALAEPLTALYHAGEFSAHDVTSVSDVLRYWCLSLPFYAGYMYLYRSFSAMHDLKLITWIDAVGRVFHAGMYAMFTTGLSFGLVGIPLADTIYYFVMFFILCFVMRKKVGGYGLPSVFATGIRSFIAAVIPAYLVLILFQYFGSSATIPQAFLSIVVLGLIGLAIFYGLAKLFRVQETELIRSLARRLTRRVAGNRG